MEENLLSTSTILEEPLNFLDSMLDDELLERGLISPDQKLIASKEYKKSNRTLEEIYVTLGFISEEVLTSVRSEKFNLKLFDPKKHIVDPLILKNFPQPLAEKYRVLPLSYDGQTLSIAITDPLDLRSRDVLVDYFPSIQCLKIFVACESELLGTIDRVYDNKLNLESVLKTLEQGENNKNKGGSVTDFLHLVIIDAVKKGASDIHFEPDEHYVRVRYRIDGKLRIFCAFHRRHWANVLVRLKLISGMNIAESRLPQDGRFNSIIMGREIDFRLATHPTIFGEKIVIRVLDKMRGLKSLKELGFSKKKMDKLKRIIQKPEGIIILSGSTGSGKTTTLYALLSNLEERQLNIMTLEEPIEYKIPFIQQTAIMKEIGFSFSEGVRSLLRQDPDVILIGEMRDSDTATMALRASMTGHLVLTTLHARTPYGALGRLIDLGVTSHAIISNIRAILSQKLIRLLCVHCKISDTSNTKNAEYFRSNGCELCGFTGYKGRTVLSELMVFDKVTCSLILDNAPPHEFENKRRQRKENSIFDEGMALMKLGHTSFDELSTLIDSQEEYI